MKLCYVHEEYPEETNFGGIATYQKTVAEQMVKDGNEVYVICRSLKGDNEYIENGVNIIRVYVPETKNQYINYVRYRKKVANILTYLQNQHLIEIIEVPDWGAETVFFEKKRKIPLVVRLHTPLKVWLNYNQNNFGMVKNKMLKWESRMIKSADLLTCCSLALKNVVVKDFEIDANEIIVTPNPANITDFFVDKKVEKDNKIIYVGSLEERKGVLVLGEAINIVLKKYPDIEFDFYGRDTSRNKFNTSTKEVVYSIVDKKYRSQINFKGHLENNKLNNILNNALVGVYPSLFDNFPYVVLESMACGLHIVGSKNSGMVEMLSDESSIYETGNVIDLANKIIEKYELSIKSNLCFKNEKRLNKFYNPHYVCSELVKLYTGVVKKYYVDKDSNDNLENVLKKITDEPLRKVQIKNCGLANLVYKVKTDKSVYIIKKYLYDYNFDLSKILYKKYEDSGIYVIKPLNKNVINYKGFNYNIFEYKKSSLNLNKFDYEFLNKILLCERNVNQENTIISKFNKYYNYLSELRCCDDCLKNDCDFVLDISKKIIDIPFLKEAYLNHGDISKSNLIYSKNRLFLIDFDEVTVSSPLYDFAVIIVKMCIKNGRINYKKYNFFKESMKVQYSCYSDSDFKVAVQFYLCKILLEKFYLHRKGDINLFSKKQLADSYKKYLKLLNSVV